MNTHVTQQEGDDFHISSLTKKKKVEKFWEERVRVAERGEKEGEYFGENRKQDTTVTDGNHHQSEFEDIAAGKDDRNRERAGSIRMKGCKC